MAETSVGASGLFMLVLLTFYAGELVWRERQVKLDQVLDASPVPTASIVLGKMSAMVLLLLAFATNCFQAGRSQWTHSRSGGASPRAVSATTRA